MREPYSGPVSGRVLISSTKLVLEMRPAGRVVILALPEGYETNLAERAVNLSGGQKQRIAIARAFLKDAPVLLLDEPASALDGATEAALLSALQDLVKGRTTLIIAHRFSTVSLADRIVVLRDGVVVEHGTHAELTKTGAYYRELYRTQSGIPGTLPESD